MTRNIFALAAGFAAGFLAVALVNWGLLAAGSAPETSATLAKAAGAVAGGLVIGLTASSGPLKLAFVFGLALFGAELALHLQRGESDWLALSYNALYPLYSYLGARAARLRQSFTKSP